MVAMSRSLRLKCTLLVTCAVLVSAFPVAGGLAQEKLDRTVLPIPEPMRKPITELDVRKATAPPRFEVKAPTGAPNVVIVLIDDMGFGQPSTFGGPIAMPTLDRLASEGLRYNNFHVTALCSPTRAALLTGRNHHTGNAGAVMDISTAFPGNNGVRPNSVAPLAEMLRLNGFAHGHVRQVARSAALGDQRFGAIRSVADEFGL